MRRVIRCLMCRLFTTRLIEIQMTTWKGFNQSNLNDNGYHEYRQCAALITKRLFNNLFLKGKFERLC